MSEVTDRIRSLGHWDVAIRPANLKSDRVDYGLLEDLLEGLAVRLRGWPVPYIDHRNSVIRQKDWVGQDITPRVVPHIEAWRFFTSGQFTHLRAISADTRRPEDMFVPEGFQGVIELWEIVFYLTELFELAARLSLSAAGDEVMTIDASLNGMEHRGLIVGMPRRMPFDEPYRSTMASHHHRTTLPRDELVADARTPALKTSREFILRFGWKPSLDQLADIQRELIER